MEKEYVKILKKKKKKVQAVNRKNPPIIYYKPNKINVQSLDSRVFINVQKYCKESFFFFLIKTNTGLTIFYITVFRVKQQQQQQNYVLMFLLNIVTSITSK